MDLPILNNQPKSSGGLTLIRLLVVIGILVAVLSLVLITINPDRQFKAARDTQRRSDVNEILNAVYQYAADNRGATPDAITTSTLTVKSGVGGADICSTLVTTYIATMPFDPSAGSYTDCTNYNTGYTIAKSASNNKVTVTAKGELTSTISVSR